MPPKKNRKAPQIDDVQFKNLTTFYEAVLKLGQLILPEPTPMNDVSDPNIIKDLSLTFNLNNNLTSIFNSLNNCFETTLRELDIEAAEYAKIKLLQEAKAFWTNKIKSDKTKQKENRLTTFIHETGIYASRTINTRSGQNYVNYERLKGFPFYIHEKDTRDWFYNNHHLVSMLLYGALKNNKLDESSDEKSKLKNLDKSELDLRSSAGTAMDRDNAKLNNAREIFNEYSNKVYKDWYILICFLRHFIQNRNETVTIPVDEQVKADVSVPEGNPGLFYMSKTLKAHCLKFSNTDNDKNVKRYIEKLIQLFALKSDRTSLENILESIPDDQKQLKDKLSQFIEDKTLEDKISNILSNTEKKDNNNKLKGGENSILAIIQDRQLMKKVQENFEKQNPLLHELIGCLVAYLFQIQSNRLVRVDQYGTPLVQDPVLQGQIKIGDALYKNLVGIESPEINKIKDAFKQYTTKGLLTNIRDFFVGKQSFYEYLAESFQPDTLDSQPFTFERFNFDEKTKELIRNMLAPLSVQPGLPGGQPGLTDGQPGLPGRQPGIGFLNRLSSFFKAFFPSANFFGSGALPLPSSSSRSNPVPAGLPWSSSSSRSNPVLPAPSSFIEPNPDPYHKYGSYPQKNDKLPVVHYVKNETTNETSPNYFDLDIPTSASSALFNYNNNKNQIMLNRKIILWDKLTPESTWADYAYDLGTKPGALKSNALLSPSDRAVYDYIEKGQERHHYPGDLNDVAFKMWQLNSFSTFKEVLLEYGNGFNGKHHFESIKKRKALWEGTMLPECRESQPLTKQDWMEPTNKKEIKFVDKSTIDIDPGFDILVSVVLAVPETLRLILSLPTSKQLFTEKLQDQMKAYIWQKIAKNQFESAMHMLNIYTKNLLNEGDENDIVQNLCQNILPSQGLKYNDIADVKAVVVRAQGLLEQLDLGFRFLCNDKVVILGNSSKVLANVLIIISIELKNQGGSLVFDKIKEFQISFEKPEEFLKKNELLTKSLLLSYFEPGGYIRNQQEERDKIIIDTIKNHWTLNDGKYLQHLILDVR